MELKKYLFVDYENIGLDDIAALAATEVEVWVFVGPNQRTMPTKTVRSLLSLGPGARIVQITKQGKNSLDFHICFELGALSREEPKPEAVYVLSGDKGYDAVLGHANQCGLSVKRISALSEIARQKGKAAVPSITGAIVAHLRKIQGNQRPRKRTTLQSYLTSHFKKSHSAEEIRAAIEELAGSGQLAEENGKLKYNL